MNNQLNPDENYWLYFKGWMSPNNTTKFNRMEKSSKYLIPVDCTNLFAQLGIGCGILCLAPGTTE